MFESLLVANRGEIACRIMRTARRLGLRTIAVYSEADAMALHVRCADQAYCIGPAAARDSYLHVDRILAAARASGAQAIHPGYGFLSESAHFALACAQAGHCFVGPPVEAIRAMGSKSHAKALLQGAGVPLTPGYHGAEQDPSLLASEAGRIGYPVLIKASAGGGGKGMRRVDRPQDFGAALAACRREALGAFGSDQVLIEKFLLRPRHIEMQIFADTHGNAVHLYERDCSVQRRHQKVIEEAPAPGMSPRRRAAMGAAAVQVARAVGYVGAGTVEFIVPHTDTDAGFYFMEMNTRLQVEHPVTEMITGLDLVEWQLRVAAGEPLPLAQEQLSIRGHAIEARLYAEDADNDFTPATGTLDFLEFPPSSDHVRVDAGVEEGDAITPHYDPMIAKLIAWGADRTGARAQLRQALAATRIVGVVNNRDFLARLIDAPAFAAADLDTALIEREAQNLQATSAVPQRSLWLLATLAHLAAEARRDALAAPRDAPWSRRDDWRANSQGARTVNLTWRGHSVDAPPLVRLVRVHGVTGGLCLTLDGQASLAHARLEGGASERGLLRAWIGDQTLSAGAVHHAGRWHLFVGGVLEIFECRDLTQAPAQSPGSDDEHRGTVLAPMPGKVIALLVEPGAQVQRHTPLLIVEAMKMEHTVRAPRAGRLQAFRVRIGDQVAMAEELMDFADDPTPTGTAP